MNQGGWCEAFSIHVNVYFAMRYVECFLKCWHVFVTKLERPDLLEGHLGDGSVAVGRSVNSCVVHQDKAAVEGGADIEFNIVSAKFDGGADTGKAVLGVADMCGAMGDDGYPFWLGALRKSESQQTEHRYEHGHPDVMIRRTRAIARDCGVGSRLVISLRTYWYCSRFKSNCDRRAVSRLEPGVGFRSLLGRCQNR